MASSPCSRSRRVQFLVTTLDWGGAESQVIDMALRLQARGYEVEVVVMISKAVRKSVLDSAGIAVYTLGMRRGVPDVRGIWRLGRRIRDFQPHVVHAHMVHANILARVTRLFSPVPVVISSAHNTNEGGGWRAMAYRGTERLTDIMTNVSPAAVRASIDSGSSHPERIVYMPNGVDLARFCRRDSVRQRIRAQLGFAESFVWLAVGYLHEQKDYPNMIEAFARVSDHSSDPHLLIVGQGPEEDAIKEAIRTRGLNGRVHLLGRRDDVPDLLNGADSFVLSSAWEGLPVVLLEAAASSLPIVATDVGGNEEIVVNGVTGRLVPARDTMALASAMAAIMATSASERSSMGARAALHARERFDLESIVDRWERIYLSCGMDTSRPSRLGRMPTNLQMGI